MRHPQVLVYEGDGRLAEVLRPLVEERRWALRQPRKLATILAHLERGGPAVVVVKLGRHLERELTLVERTAWLSPDAAAVVVADQDMARVAGLAWDLGAAYVLTPPLSREQLPEIVVGLMGDGGGTTPPG
jgi:DNA-binding NtrC family response regulator